MQSMTGFGRGSAESDGRQITIELKSVNHRYLDLSMRTPRSLAFAEEPLRKRLSSIFSRGHIDVFVTYRNLREDMRTISVDEHLIKVYQKAAEQAAHATGYENDITLSYALRWPDVLYIEETPEDTDAVVTIACEAAQMAADDLLRMRKQEGERLTADLMQRMNILRGIVQNVEKRAPLIVKEQQAKLYGRIAALTDESVEVDQTRLANEIALFADRTNVDEELVRLNSHCTQMADMLKSEGAIGRKLDFIIQEMNRELNTIGSKASDLDILNDVIAGKTEVEKIREQVQNIE